VGPPAPRPLVLAELDDRIVLEERVGGLAGWIARFVDLTVNRCSSSRWLTARGPLEAMADLAGVEGLLARAYVARQGRRKKLGPTRAQC